MHHQCLLCLAMDPHHPDLQWGSPLRRHLAWCPHHPACRRRHRGPCPRPQTCLHQDLRSLRRHGHHQTCPHSLRSGCHLLHGCRHRCLRQGSGRPVCHQHPPGCHHQAAHRRRHPHRASLEALLHGASTGDHRPWGCPLPHRACRRRLSRGLLLFRARGLACPHGPRHKDPHGPHQCPGLLDYHLLHRFLPTEEGRSDVPLWFWETAQGDQQKRLPKQTIFLFPVVLKLTVQGHPENLAKKKHALKYHKGLSRRGWCCDVVQQMLMDFVEIYTYSKSTRSKNGLLVSYKTAAY
uniref:Uncharacterized protein n=1 Tax=Heterosigma akashiwo TaxID=2829 RepID=A0A7S3UWY8_HETAK